MSSLRKDGLLPARAGLWNEIHSTSPLHAALTDNGGTLKAAVQLGGFLPLQHHLNGPALFPLLIVMKAFHYIGSLWPTSNYEFNTTNVNWNMSSGHVWESYSGLDESLLWVLIRSLTHKEMHSYQMSGDVTKTKKVNITFRQQLEKYFCEHLSDKKVKLLCNVFSLVFFF